MSIRTLPQWCLAWNVNPSALRTFLRRHRRDLVRLGQPVGPALGYDPQAAEQIRSAFEGRRKLTGAVAKT